MTDRAIILGAFVLGLFAGPALDQIHVANDALSYAHPWWLHQAWWVGPQFGIAFVVIALGTLAIDRRFGAGARAPSPPRLAWQLAAFVGAYLVTGFGHGSPRLVFAVLLIALLARVALARPDRAMLLGIVLLAIGGSAYEATLSSLPGTFAYLRPGLGSIPVWLPLLYAHAGIVACTALRRVRAAA